MRSLSLIAVTVCMLAWAAWTRGRPEEVPFAKHTIDLGANEACAFADINGDGRLDIVSGENWFEAPRWTRHKFREFLFENNYIDDFSDLPVDVNGDGHVDVVSCSWFARRLSWWQNPGTNRIDWKEHVIDGGLPIEFAFLVDLDNDGQSREVLPQYMDPKAQLAWYEIKSGDFVKHVVGPATEGHGIGVGDVNSDGRNDILAPKGWLEAPADPRKEGWTWHADFDLGGVGFIHVLDVNEDGRNDIVAALAHAYGVFWLEQGEANQWTRHVIDESWSQAHAVSLADLNGDGRKDLLTGKRYMAHNGHDRGEGEPLGIYWYEHQPSEDGKTVTWTRHIIDYSTRAGGGMQIAVADLDGDGDADLAAAGKSGLFLFENLRDRK